MRPQLDQTGAELSAIERQVPGASSFTPVYNALQWMRALLSIRGERSPSADRAKSDGYPGQIVTAGQLPSPRVEHTVMRPVQSALVSGQLRDLQFERVLYQQACDVHARSLDDLEGDFREQSNRLDKLTAELDSTRKEYTELAADIVNRQRSRSGGQLELALAGSFGFWATVGLLAGRTLVDPRRRTTTSARQQVATRLRTIVAGLPLPHWSGRRRP